MYFASILQLNTEGGTATANSTTLTIANATSFTILITAATGYRGFQTQTRHTPRTSHRQRETPTGHRSQQTLQHAPHRAHRRPSASLPPRLPQSRHSQHQRNQPTSASKTSPPPPIHPSSRSTSNTAAISSSAARAPARNPPTSRASGTTRSRRHGVPTGPPTSTSR